MKRWLLAACLAALLMPLVSDAQYPPPGGGGEELVRDWYVRYLGREPDATAGSWSDQLRQGQQPEVVLAQILASSEYYIRGGSSPQGYIRRLLTDLTGRPPGPREMTFWVNQLYRMDRQDVVLRVLQRYPGSATAPPAAPVEEPGYDYRRPPYRPAPRYRD